MQLLFAAGDHAAAVDGSDDLDRVEAEPGDVTKAAQPVAFVTRTERMRCVFQHAQAVLLGQAVHTVHIAGYAGKVQRVDGLGTGSDQRLGLLHVDPQVVVAHVAQHRFGAAHADRLMIRNVVERRCDHLVTRPDSGRAQTQVKGRGAGIGCDDVAALQSEIGGDQVFELLGDRAHAQPAHVQRIGHVLERVHADCRREDGNLLHCLQSFTQRR